MYFTIVSLSFPYHHPTRLQDTAPPSPPTAFGSSAAAPPRRPPGAAAPAASRRRRRCGRWARPQRGPPGGCGSSPPSNGALVTWELEMLEMLEMLVWGRRFQKMSGHEWILLKSHGGNVPLKTLGFVCEPSRCGWSTQDWKPVASRVATSDATSSNNKSSTSDDKRSRCKPTGPCAWKRRPHRIPVGWIPHPVAPEKRTKGPRKIVSSESGTPNNHPNFLSFFCVSIPKIYIYIHKQ